MLFWPKLVSPSHYKQMLTIGPLLITIPVIYSMHVKQFNDISVFNVHDVMIITVAMIPWLLFLIRNVAKWLCRDPSLVRNSVHLITQKWQLVNTEKLKP